MWSTWRCTIFPSVICALYETGPGQCVIVAGVQGSNGENVLIKTGSLMPKNVAWFLARYLQFPNFPQMTSQDEDGRGDSSNDGSSTIRPVSDRLLHTEECVETVGNLPIADSHLHTAYDEAHPLLSESCALLVHYSKDDRALP
ncbi:hypothetical protein M514_02327 [Trichuris suis]|uniref:Uncharacterized protein n=1 Tax=Trichuris suis TaxID=68888 RepID=A0A085NFD0_9BILA|nr:hypothetical protein M514_02327 [Trichuris suis]